MNLKIDRDIQEGKEDKLNISVKEFKKIYKESCKNIIEVNKKIEEIKEIFEVIDLQKLEKLEIEIREKFNNLEDYLNIKKYDIEVYKELILKIREDIKNTEKKVFNIDINNLKLQKEIKETFKEFEKIKSYFLNGFILLSVFSFLSILFFIIFR